jgi:hypothetical protein
MAFLCMLVLSWDGSLREPNAVSQEDTTSVPSSTLTRMTSAPLAGCLEGRRSPYCTILHGYLQRERS